MSGEEIDGALALLLESVADVGGETVALGQGLVELGEMPGVGVAVARGEGCIAADEWPAVPERWFHRRTRGRPAQGAVGVVDAGDGGSGIDGGVVASHDPQEAGFVGDDLALKAGVPGGGAEALFRFLACGAGEAGPVRVSDCVGEVLASGEGFFRLDFGAES